MFADGCDQRSSSVIVSFICRWMALIGYRLSFGVVGRLPRVVPDPGAEFNGYHVPGGVGACTLGIGYLLTWIDCCEHELLDHASQ
jgi:hypothetical protein